MSSQNPQEEPFSEANLESPEYRERLMRKLNCLIAVLEVATAKVKKSLDGPAADVERLARIRTNLQSTLEVCLRARAALERREALPRDLPENLTRVMNDIPKAAPTSASAGNPKNLPRGARIELRSQEERRKFQRMGSIDRRTIALVDFEDLARRLQV
ncbi:MAG: hypothetical protein IPJ77_24560 [Planctomycetes bacterium]|nr:hypothetical protein [Planctomycetota bacterium]